MFSISVAGWIVLAIAGFLIGISKTGIPGVGTLAIPMAALVIPARASTGVILPMLIFADFFAVGYYRRHAVWKHLIRLLPWAAAGIIAGYLALGRMNDAQLRPFIGFIVLAMLALNFSDGLERWHVPERWWFAAVLGLLAGATTMMANAAGPIMMLYLLSMKLPKDQFIGTGAWYFFLLNWFKVPFSANLGLINAESLRLNAMLAPVVAVGALAGILALKHISDRWFNRIVQVITGLTAVKLIF